MDKLLDFWWVFLLRGVLAVLFSLLAITWPEMTLLLLVTFFAAYCLADGVGAIVMCRDQPRWCWYLLQGLAGIAAGIVAFVYPQVTALTLIFIIGAWAIVKGVLEIGTAIELRKVLRHEGIMMLAGVTAVLFGILLFARPDAGALAMAWLIASFVMFYGVLFIALGLEMYFYRRELRGVKWAPAFP